MLSLTSCGGCDYALVRAFIRLGIEPDYHKMMVEETRLPRRIKLLVVTGCVSTPEQERLLVDASTRATSILLAGCCALRGPLAPRGQSPPCKPARSVLGHGRSILTAPGCPALEPILERLIATRLGLIA